MKSNLLSRRPSLALLAGLATVLLTTIMAVGAVALADAWGWGTNVGWINLGPANDEVVVCADHLEGYAWGENVGWIRLGTFTGCGAHTYANTSNTDYGVNRDGANNLSGFAWGTNVGWINFDPTNGGVSVDPSTGKLVGYAWGENVGWIRFDPSYSLTGPPPTAALVTHFSVRSVPGGNLVRWETATEARVTGFNVQRAVEPTGPWTQVNDALIPATGGTATGGRYELLDAGAMAGTWHTIGSRWWMREHRASSSGQWPCPARRTRCSCLRPTGEVVLATQGDAAWEKAVGGATLTMCVGRADGDNRAAPERPGLRRASGEGATVAAATCPALAAPHSHPARDGHSRAWLSLALVHLPLAGRRERERREHRRLGPVRDQAGSSSWPPYSRSIPPMARRRGGTTSSAAGR